MRRVRITAGLARWVLPIIAFSLFLAGCGSSTISPAEATVTAIVTQAAGQPNCANSLSPTLSIIASSTTSSTIVTLVTLGKTNVIFEGTCWTPGRTVTLGVLGHPATASQNQSGIITPLVINGVTQTAQVQNDGTFSINIMPLTTSLSVYAWNSHLPFVAFSPGFADFAGTSVEVSYT